MTESVTWLEVTWTLVAAGAIGFTAWIIDDNVRNFAAIRRAVKQGRAAAWGPRWWVAFASLVSSVGMFIVWLGFAAIGIVAMSVSPRDSTPEIQMVQTISGWLSPGNWLHDVIYVILIIFFAFFYTAVVFNPVDVADNMKKAGGYIPGIRPGQKTAEYIERVLSRITLSGAIYLCVVCLLPTILVRQFNVPFYFGGTALLIVVGVALDTVAQAETHLITRNYEGFMKRGRLRGRRG